MLDDPGLMGPDTSDPEVAGLRLAIRKAHLAPEADAVEAYIALAGLSVTAEDERVSRGHYFHSQRGKYTCLVPEGFMAILPARSAPAPSGSRTSSTSRWPASP